MKSKKLLSTLTLMMISVMMMAQTTLTLTPSGGTFTSNGTSSYYAKWTSTSLTPQVVLSCPANNMQSSGTTFQLYPGDSGATYTITVANGYKITGYKFNATVTASSDTYNNGSNTYRITPSEGGNAQTITVTRNGNRNNYTYSANTVTVSTSGITSSSASFSIAGANKAFNVTSFTVTVESTSTTSESLSVTADTKTALFNNPSYGTCYRIPAIVKTQDGKILAISDLRNSSYGDIGGGNHISIVQKVSTDNGSSWGTQSTIVPGTASSGFDFAHGDAAVVCDRETGKLLLMCASGTTSYTNNGCLVGRYYSTDNGTTWTGGEMTTSNGLPSAVSSKKFFSSGRILQSKIIRTGSSYRIYSGLCTGSGSRVVYSDDFGQSWSTLGNAISGGDECKVEELPDGSVLLSCRKNGDTGRIFNVYKYDNTQYNSGSWQTAITSTGITAASCNGEILLVPTSEADTYVLLQSVARSSNRENVSVYYKKLKTTDNYTTPSYYNTWDGYTQLSTTTSCYSTMCLDANGDVAFLYEENQGNGYDIMFRTLTVDYTAASTTPEEPILPDGTQYNVVCTLNGVAQAMSSDAFGYTVLAKSTYSDRNLTYIPTSDNASIIVASITSGTPTTLTSSNIRTYIAIQDVAGYDCKVTVSGNTITIAYTTRTSSSAIPQTGKTYTIKAYCKNGSGTVKQYYLKSINDNGSLKISLVDTSTNPTLTEDFYWTVSQGPNRTRNNIAANKNEPVSYMYISAFRGDGYLGYARGIDYGQPDSSTETGYKETNSGAGVTDNLDNEFQIMDFTEGNQAGSVRIHYWGNQLTYDQAYGMLYTRYLLARYDGSDINWSNTTGNAQNLNGNYWSADYIFTEVTAGTGIGSWDAPTYDGFDITFTRSDNDAYTKNPNNGSPDFNLYATCKLPYAVTLPEGIAAYTAIPKTDKHTDIELLPMTLTNNVLPRETAVLLKKAGTTASPITETIKVMPYTEENIVFDETGDNVFVGTLGAKSIVLNDGIYVLGKKNGLVAFYKAASGSMKNNRAYFNGLKFATEEEITAANGLNISFEGEEGNLDGIKEIRTENTDNRMYDLQGRQVLNQNAHGLYIINGRKVLK